MDAIDRLVRSRHTDGELLCLLIWQSCWTPRRPETVQERKTSPGWLEPIDCFGSDSLLLFSSSAIWPI